MSIGWPDAFGTGRHPCHHPEEQITLEVLPAWSCQYQRNCQSNIRVAVFSVGMLLSRGKTLQSSCARGVSLIA